ncbi:MAG: glycosyltransferase family 39 protein [Deltaproteobacteria bacterium]|nr:glycosyltransferase family 39 protein [Deltaproteobacteria bacterium]
MSSLTPRKLLAAFFIVHVAVRPVTFAYSDNGIGFHHNAYDRGLFVQRWLGAEDFRFVPDIAYGPVHYYLVAATMAAVPDPTDATRYLSFLSSIAVFFLVAGLARRIFGAWEGAAAGLLVALHPHGIRLSVVGLDMMPYAALLLGGFYAFARFREERAAAWAALSGALFTLAAATRFEAWIVLPVAAVAAIAADRKKGARSRRARRRVSRRVDGV